MGLTLKAQPNNPTDTKEVKTVTKDYYNNPNHSFLGADANGIVQFPTVSGGSPMLGVHAKVFFVPKSFLYLAAHTAIYSSTGLNTDKNTAFVSSVQVQAGIFPFKKEIVKYMTYQTAEKGLMYTWQYPVKRNFKFGLVAGVNTGKRFTQTGSDKETAITWGNAVEPTGNRLTLPETISEGSVGLALMTTAWSKSSIILPNGKEVKKRYKALTMVSLSYVSLLSHKYPGSIDVESRGGTRAYTPVITDLRKSGIKLQGDFRRKWLSMKIEAGIATGANYRFAESENTGILDRSYFGLGFGMGWM